MGVTKRTATVLLEALLLKPDVADQKCADYEQLITVFLISEEWHQSVSTSLCFLDSFSIYYFHDSTQALRKWQLILRDYIFVTFEYGILKF